MWNSGKRPDRERERERERERDEVGSTRQV